MIINSKPVEQVMKELSEPFHPDDIEWRVGSTNREKTKGMALAYVTNRAIMNRLDSVVGAFNWQNVYKEWKTESQLCGIGVRYGDGDDWVWKWDGADDSNMDAIKGGLSDSMKRAGYQWGIGRYLYKLESQWYELDQYKKFKTTPKLPAWALPAKYKPNDSKQTTSKASVATTAATPATSEGNKTESERTGMTDKQRERWNVVKALKENGKSDKEAQAWIDAQKEKGRDYADMMKIIEEAKKGAK